MKRYALIFAIAQLAFICYNIYNCILGDDFVDICKGDVLTMKKPHPCGSNKMLVLRSGMDFKLRCEGCGREFMIIRSKAEKNIKSIDTTQRISDKGINADV